MNELTDEEWVEYKEYLEELTPEEIVKERIEYAKINRYCDQVKIINFNYNPYGYPKSL